MLAFLRRIGNSNYSATHAETGTRGKTTKRKSKGSPAVSRRLTSFSSLGWITLHGSCTKSALMTSGVPKGKSGTSALTTGSRSNEWAPCSRMTDQPVVLFPRSGRLFLTHASWSVRNFLKYSTELEYFYPSRRQWQLRHSRIRLSYSSRSFIAFAAFARGPASLDASMWAMSPIVTIGSYSVASARSSIRQVGTAQRLAARPQRILRVRSL